MGKKVKVVFDSNVWISLFTNRVLSREFSEISGGIVVVYVSEEIMREIAKALTYPRISKLLNDAGIKEKEVLRAIARNSEAVNPKQRIKCVQTDPDDDKIVECAVEAGADVIVTGYNHLLKLAHYKKIKILKPREFLDCYA